MSHPMLSTVLAGPAAETTRLLAYWVLAIISVAAALGMVLARKAVHCAMLLAVVMLSLAALYLMLGAPFLAFARRHRPGPARLGEVRQCERDRAG